LPIHNHVYVKAIVAQQNGNFNGEFAEFAERQIRML
jgi:hypothetical protein